MSLDESRGAEPNLRSMECLLSRVLLIFAGLGCLDRDFAGTLISIAKNVTCTLTSHLLPCIRARLV